MRWEPLQVEGSAHLVTVIGVLFGVPLHGGATPPPVSGDQHDRVKLRARP